MKWILLMIGLMLLIAPTSAINLGAQYITSNVTWQDSSYVITGDVEITHNGTLNIINSTVEMNCSTDLEYQIKLNADGKLLLTDSNITSLNKNWNYGYTNNSQIIMQTNASHPGEKPTIQAENTLFSYLGSADAAFRHDEAIAIDMSSTDSWIRNSTFEYVVGGASVLSGAHLDVTGTKFENIGSSKASFVATGIYYYYPTSTVSTLFTDNYFDNITGATDSQPTNIDTMSDLTYDNVTIYNLTAGAGHHINFYGNIVNLTMNNIYEKGGKGITFNNPNTGWSSHNISMENISWVDSIGGVIIFTLNYYDISVKNVTANDGELFLTTCTGDYYCLWDSNFTDITWSGTSSVGLIRMVMKDSEWSDFDINGTAGRSMFWLNQIQSAHYPNIQSKNNTFTNFIFNGTHGSTSVNGSFRDAAAIFCYAHNNSFVDWDFKMDSGYDIWISKNVTDNRWINVNENNVGIESGSKYEKYFYKDVIVQTSGGTPISGATVTFTNEVDNSSYPCIDSEGNNQSTFTSRADGHILLPVGNRSESPVLLDYWQNNTATISMTWQIGANATGYTANDTAITGLNITSGYYRSSPNTYQNTSTIVLSGWSHDSNSTYEGQTCTYYINGSRICDTPLESDKVIFTNNIYPVVS